jgi:hypothetical protein
MRGLLKDEGRALGDTTTLADIRDQRVFPGAAI